MGFNYTIDCFGTYIFLLSTAAIFRSVGGEGKMGIGVLAFYEAWVVFFVSLLVNIITVRQPLGTLDL